VKWEDRDQKIITEISAGKPADVITVGSESMVRLAQRGMLLPVTDLIDAHGRDDYFASLVSEIDNEIFWVPYASNTNLMWWRSDLIKEKGLYLPATWDDFLIALEKITEDRSGDGVIEIYGHATSWGTSNANFFHTMQNAWSNEAYMFDSKHQVVLDKSPYRERFIETLNFRKKQKPFVPPGATTYEFKDLLQSFYSGKVASIIYGPRILTQVHQYAPKLVSVTEGFVMPFNRKIHHITAPDGYAIPKGVEYPALSKKLISHLVSGSEYIDFLHTVPLHLAPPKKSVAYSAEYLSNPIIKAHPRTTKIFYAMLAIAYPRIGPHRSDNPVLAELAASKEMNHMVTRVVVKDADPEAIVDELIEKLKKLRAEVLE
jgi:multiple sugar transport system substrate-binding protein